jgi:UDP-N-acetyl-D-mannosaminuronic acid dehydrogenase
MKKKTICVIGLGYIGLPTAALLAKKGFSVVGVDINEKIVSTINEGKTHIVEPNLAEVVKLSVSKGKLKAFNEIHTSDVYIICVPTPFHNDETIPKPNIDYIISATISIAKFIKFGDLIILESTSPVGTTEKVKKTLIECGTKLEGVNIAYCPERVLPGNIMTELVENDRIVGGLTPLSAKEVANFYRLFVSGDVVETDAKTAEMCKLTENSFRDLNIAFANELSMICDNQKINVWELIKLANKHPRVNILQPGTGVGGHCIAVDPWFIISQDIKNSNLIRKARDVNDSKTKWVINKIKDTANRYNLKTGKMPKIICLGITFKPNVNDLRESRALKVAETLFDEGYNISVVEPNIFLHKKIPILKFPEAMNSAEIVCILVKHREFLETEAKIQIKKYEALDFCGIFS